MKKVVVWIGISTAFFGIAATELSEVIKYIGNVDQLRKTYGVDTYPALDLHNIKIAVLDRGFSTVTKVGDTDKVQVISGQLPSTAVVVEKYSDFFGKEECPERKLELMEHGGVMAQTVWAMTGNDPLGPQFYLLNASGITNFGCAVRYAREIAKVDIILFSQNYEFGGNFNGGGFINAMVNEATASGILWINAAGNYGNRVYNGPIPETTTSLHLVSNASPNSVTVTLAWPGSDSDKIGTDNDLDFEVVDKITGESKKATNKRQVRFKSEKAKEKDSVPPPPLPESELGGVTETVVAAPVLKKDSNESTVPFEKAVVVLGMTKDNKPKEYEIRITRKGGSFNRTDQMRVAVMPDGTAAETVVLNGKEVPRFVLKEAKNEKSIMIPGDNPNVVTVGDPNSYSAKGPTTDGRTKPELVMRDSHVDLITELAEGGTSTLPQGGTSHAAAMFAGWSVLQTAIRLKHGLPKLVREDVIRFVQTGKTPSTIRNNIVEGSIPAGAQATTMENLRENYALGAGLFDALDLVTPETPFMPFVAEDGSYFLGVGTHPATLDRVFTTFPAQAEMQKGTLNQWQFFVSMRNPTPQEAKVSNAAVPLFVSTPSNAIVDATGRVSRGQYPWEMFQSYSKQDFVEIRQIQFSTEKVAGTTVHNLFKAPSYEQIVNATRR